MHGRTGVQSRWRTGSVSVRRTVAGDRATGPRIRDSGAGGCARYRTGHYARFGANAGRNEPPGRTIGPRTDGRHAVIAIPALDLRGGAAVRLAGGEYSR